MCTIHAVLPLILIKIYSPKGLSVVSSVKGFLSSFVTFKDITVFTIRKLKGCTCSRHHYMWSFSIA